MGNWLQRILVPAKGAKKSPPQVRKSGKVPAHPSKKAAPMPKDLPNATVIYGIGASLLFVASFSLAMEGKWIPSLLVFFLGICLIGFALHLFKHQD
ncbi:MAG: hypothetical protein WC464_02945 [Bdellovibrionales bacterium]